MPAETLRHAAHPLTGDPHEFDALLELIGDARIVLLGESSHGTHEFYRLRAVLTRRLLQERGFTTVAVEADWPDAYRVNRYVRGMSDDRNAAQALDDFQRFPTWMWRNTEVLEFVEWLSDHNSGLAPGAGRVGFYGLDLYSLHASIEAVLAFLDDADPEGAQRARQRYACFDHFGEDALAYGHATSMGLAESCERQAVQQLLEMQRQAADLAKRNGRIPEDEFFFAEQNARLVQNAEEYYRTMFRGRASSWNLRDRHMADTLDALIDHFDSKGTHTKVVVWAHNSHIGDARATEMSRRGEWNIGQLARERHEGSVRLIGFTTSRGTVTAASDWGEAAQRMRIVPALPGSFEAILHQVGIGAFMLRLRNAGVVADLLAPPRLERAIGVIYRPDTERVSHYFHASLSEQFDAVIHVDETQALEPLERTGSWEAGDAPETYPFAV
jgi:erythromycin esterase-like protein